MKNSNLSGTAEKYYYETPMWAVAVLCSAAGVLSLVCIAAFLNWNRWGIDGPSFFKWFVLLIGLVFLVAALKPQNWRPWRYFYADNEGIHFPSACPQTKATTWLRVPWSRVGTIKKERFYNRSKGPSIELLLQDDEIHDYFRDVKLVKMFLGQGARESEFFKVGYSNAFKSVDETVRVLNDLKQKYR